MRKILPLLLFVAIGGVVFGQNIRFSYRVTNPDPANNQSKLTVYISKIGAGSENISGLNYGFYYTNTEATVWGQTAAFLSNNMTAAQLALCVNTDATTALGWSPDLTGAVTNVVTPPPGVPSVYNRLFTGAVVDGNGVGTDITSAMGQVPLISLILDNTIGGAPINTDSAYQAGSDTNPAWEYSNINFEGFPVIVIGTRLQTLPIELVVFKADKYKDRSADLTWTTASEINSSHFLVQRSFDTKTWSTVGKVAAAGNSQIIQNYDFLDQNVYNGLDTRLNVYYRLQMFDLDGRNKFSPIEKLVFGNDAAKASFEASVYPNPATDGIHVSWNAYNQVQPTTVQLYDVTGKQVFTQSVSDNTNQAYLDLTANKFQSGVYIVRLMHDTESLAQQQIMIDKK